MIYTCRYEPSLSVVIFLAGAPAAPPDEDAGGPCGLAAEALLLLAPLPSPGFAAALTGAFAGAGLAAAAGGAALGAAAATAPGFAAAAFAGCAIGFAAGAPVGFGAVTTFCFFCFGGPSTSSSSSSELSSSLLLGRSALSQTGGERNRQPCTSMW